MLPHNLSSAPPLAAWLNVTVHIVARSHPYSSPPLIDALLHTRSIIRILMLLFLLEPFLFPIAPWPAPSNTPGLSQSLYVTLAV
jgi:hypothetical protein